MKIIIYYTLFVVAYIAVVVTTAMYFITWGAKRNIFEKTYVFLFSKPFDWSNSLWLLPINGIFWATIFHLLFIGIKRITRKYR